MPATSLPAPAHKTRYVGLFVLTQFLLVPVLAVAPLLLEWLPDLMSLLALAALGLGIEGLGAQGLQWAFGGALWIWFLRVIGLFIATTVGLFLIGLLR